MSLPIYIKKKGFFEKSGKLLRISQPLSYYLHHNVKFENGLTVADLMNALKSHEQDVNRTFLAYTRGFELEPFYDEMLIEFDQADTQPIDTLEFSWSVNINNIKEFGKPVYEIDEYLHLTGKKKGDKQNYGLSFSKLSQLKNATFRLNNRIEFSIYNSGEIWEEKKITKEIFLSGIKNFTFREVIGTFLHEISFFGYPIHRDEKLHAFEKQSNDITEENCIPFEQVQLDWKIRSLDEWSKKKGGKTKNLKIEKLKKEISYLEAKLIKIKPHESKSLEMQPDRTEHAE